MGKKEIIIVLCGNMHNWGSVSAYVSYQHTIIFFPPQI